MLFLVEIYIIAADFLINCKKSIVSLLMLHVKTVKTYFISIKIFLPIEKCDIWLNFSLKKWIFCCLAGIILHEAYDHRRHSP